MPKSLLIAFALMLAGCTAASVTPTALRQPDVNRPGGYPPIAAADVKFAEHRFGADDPADIPGCVRIGAVYTNWGDGDWIYRPKLWRPKDPELQRLLRERGGAMGANVLAWPTSELADLTYAFAYRCEGA